MKKINMIDVAIFVAIALALIVGFFTYKHYRQTAGDRIQTTAKVGFQVYLRGVTLTGNENPIKPGDTTFISIRNVPYTNLVVLDSRIEPKKTVIANIKGPQPLLMVDDYSQMFMYDIVVTISDMAKITKDGAVIGGNKIKIGLPITLEGQAYKLNGTVSDIRILPEQMQQVPKQQNPNAQPAQAPAQSQEPMAKQPPISGVAPAVKPAPVVVKTEKK